MPPLTFPRDFLWGTATSAYQIEGATKVEGRGESIWDTFCRHPGKIRDGSSGEVACDHYRRFREDIALMRELRLKAYRFSISWPRIQPKGRGRPNAAGLDFYSRLVDGLLDAGITPFLTLYHWDLPQSLEHRGGWSNRDIVGWFGDYVGHVVRALGDRVALWATLNEPQIFTIFGYLLGRHAPGVADPARYFPASHHVNLAHGRAVATLRSESQRIKVGTVLQLPPIFPRNDSREDLRAAGVMDGFLNRWFAEPVLLGRYPEDMLHLLGEVELPVLDGDLEAIHQPLDFVGLNVYTRLFATHDPSTPLLQARIDTSVRTANPYTDYGWEVYPESIYESLLRFKTQWGDPDVYVTENGAAYDDQSGDGAFHDDRRIEYLQGHLEQVRRAMGQGVKVKGYFVWSLLDNFEWNEGLRMRFGLIHVDFPTQRRTVRQSGFFYRDLIESQGG